MRVKGVLVQPWKIDEIIQNLARNENLNGDKKFQQKVDKQDKQDFLQAFQSKRNSKNS